jgi:hypothetical protein
MLQQWIENAVFLEDFGGIVLDVEAGATVANFLRAFVHANGPTLATEHHGTGKAADTTAGDLGMSLHAWTSLRWFERTSIRLRDAGATQRSMLRS